MSKKLMAMMKTDFKCGYCGCSLKESGVHLDHMTPKARGGDNSLENLMPSCPSCNGSKGSKTVDEFRVYIGINQSVPLEFRFSMAQCKYLSEVGAYKAIPNATVDHTFYFEGL